MKFRSPRTRPSVRSPSGSQIFTAGVDLKALIFSRALHVQSVTIDGAEVALIQLENGDWNFSTLGAAQAAPVAAPPTPGPAAPAGSAAGSLRKAHPNRKFHVSLVQNKQKRDFSDVNFELRDFSTTAALPFSLSANVGGGSVNLTGIAGPIAKSDTSETPFDTQIEIKALDQVPLTSRGRRLARTECSASPGT